MHRWRVAESRRPAQRLNCDNVRDHPHTIAEVRSASRSDRPDHPVHRSCRFFAQGGRDVALDVERQGNRAMAEQGLDQLGGSGLEQDGRRDEGVDSIWGSPSQGDLHTALQTLRQVVSAAVAGQYDPTEVSGPRYRPGSAGTARAGSTATVTGGCGCQ